MVVKFQNKLGYL